MKILIAEDDFYSGKLLQKIIEALGHQPLLAENGLKAWELFQERDIRMVITDWMMPEMDGLTLCQKIRSSAKDSYTYVIFQTAKDQKQDLIAVFEAGADDYIKKPFDPEEIKVRVKTGERIVLLEKAHIELRDDLSESRNKLRVLLDALPEEVVSMDENFQIVSANKSFIQNQGATFSEVAGKPYLTIINGEDDRSNDKRIATAMTMAFESGTPQFLSDTSTDDRGNKNYKEIKCLPVRDESGKAFQVAIISRDITDDRRKSEEIKSLNNKLKKAFFQIKGKKEELEQTLERLRDTQGQILQSEKMASVGQLAAGVAHEINNPTGFVSSNLRTLSDYYSDINGLLKQYRKLNSDLEDIIAKESLPSSIVEQVKQIEVRETEVDIDFILNDGSELLEESREGTERIKKIVQDLKNFAHPGEDKPKFADINRNLDSTLNVVSNELKYKATVIKDYGELPEVKCYPQQLNQVFVNVLVNAAQAIEKKGEIKIGTRANNGNVQVTISDTGKGIPKENLAKIFDPFFTTKEVGSGTGLGMNVAYNIIKKHNGSIEVKSETGSGTTFIIRIPVGGGHDED